MDLCSVTLTLTGWGPSLWFSVIAFSYGACIGSFLNVVIYRLPIGKSVITPVSRCPKCNCKIRFYHNVPVLGWLMLGGRCRDCREPIAFRYPLVEATLGLTLVILSWTIAAPSLDRLLAWLSAGARNSTSHYEVIATVAYHMLVLATLFCAGMIRHDGQNAPNRLFIPAFIASILLPIIYPSVRLVAFTNGWVANPTWLQSFFESTFGFVVGTALVLCHVFRSANQRRNAMLLGGLIGMSMGWQVAVLTIALSVVVQLAIVAISSQMKVSFQCSLGLAMFFVLLAVLVALPEVLTTTRMLDERFFATCWTAVAVILALSAVRYRLETPFSPALQSTT